MSRVTRPASEIERCCWPRCKAKVFDEPDAPPFCGRHLIQCAVYVTDLYGSSILDPIGEARETMADRLAEDAFSSQRVVCYVRLGDHVKIGTTANLPRRLADLHLEPDAVLATEPGDRRLEHARHAQFAAERIYRNRELFNPSPRLLAHIEDLKAA